MMWDLHDRSPDDQCSGCGAATKYVKNWTQEYECGSYRILPNPFGTLGRHESEQCRRMQAADNSPKGAKESTP